MAKGQKRNSKEPRKAKDEKADVKKSAGPKYLQQSELIQGGQLGSHKSGKKS